MDGPMTSLDHHLSTTPMDPKGFGRPQHSSDKPMHSPMQHQTIRCMYHMTVGNLHTLCVNAPMHGPMMDTNPSLRNHTLCVIALKLFPMYTSDRLMNTQSQVLT